MASQSNPLLDDSTPIQKLEYLYASNANVSNFVSVKLSGNQNYHLWKTQMLCLMETHDMCGLVDDAFDGPSASSSKIKKQYDSLLRGWIFGSVSEGVLGTIVGFGSANDGSTNDDSTKDRSAKHIWSTLETFYDSTMCSRQDSAQTNPEAKEETGDKDISKETETKENDAVSAKTESGGETVIAIKRTKEEEEIEKAYIYFKRKLLCDATIKGEWWYVKYLLLTDKDAVKDEINSDKNTVLHLAVGTGNQDIVKNLLEFIKKDDLQEVLEKKNVDGSTALHVAAIVGNRYAAKLLIEKHNALMRILDDDKQVPLFKAFSNRQFDTFIYLLEAANDDDETKKAIFEHPDHIKMGVNLLVNVISAKQYGIASKLIKTFPKFAVDDDQVLMALARTFPRGLNRWETLIYPSMGDILERVTNRKTELMFSLRVFGEYVSDDCLNDFNVMLIPIFILHLAFMGYQLIRLLILMVYFPFYMVYYLLWKIAAKFGTPIKHIEKRQKEQEGAKMALQELCNMIDDDPDHKPFYNRPILEAARRNAYQVVDEILFRSPEAILSIDESGYDIIQLAVMHRSEKIYNLIYEIPKRKSRYRMFKDSSGNNMLHMAGRLAPSYELKRRTGAALQLQRELQWCEELKTLVYPAYITEENIFKETPEMVFAREHENLVKEGEKWMKTTAESCSITAALITTIVFAAAITVPGGTNQDTGTPLFTNEVAFIIFATSDAISLFTSTTSLLVFLSILTARFAEEDFLVRLPRRLIIGLCTLFLSTTAMMVAFSATLFLVFCDKKQWMLGPICGLACFPIVLFVTLQFPLIVDLFQSTYVPIFGNRYQGRFDPDQVQGYFANSHHGKLKQRLLVKEKKVTEAIEVPGSATPNVSR